MVVRRGGGGVRARPRAGADHDPDDDEEHDHRPGSKASDDLSVLDRMSRFHPRDGPRRCIVATMVGIILSHIAAADVLAEHHPVTTTRWWRHCGRGLGRLDVPREGPDRRRGLAQLLLLARIEDPHRG